MITEKASYHRPSHTIYDSDLRHEWGLVLGSHGTQRYHSVNTADYVG